MDEDVSADTSIEDHPSQNFDDLRCSETKCYGLEENVLVCMVCERFVHYKCTKLPLYQIQAFLNAKAKRNGRWTFLCINCVEVPKDLPALCDAVKDDFTELKSDISVRDRVIEEYDDNEKKLIKSCQLLKTRNAKLKDKAIERCTVEEMNVKIQEKITELGAAMKVSIIDEIKATLMSVENQMAEVKQSYADVAKDSSQDEPNTSIKEVIKEALREEEAEETNKQKRASNVIVHGVPEQDANTDRSWVEDLMKTTHSSVTIKRITRLGKTSNDLICLLNEDEKFNLLGNLPALKGNEKFSGVSVTEDLTPEMRKKLRKLSIEAKETEKPTTEIYRVRGDSKNGFTVRKVPLRKPSATNQTSTKKNVSFSDNLTETKIIEQ